ncbi:MAG TPA: chemotaxis protein CheR, partial [Candidatus Tectomicrobia bacterium]|nr:chemotaxis protein CheR [Candidatus Tectomicrobia bacterium]
DIGLPLEPLRGPIRACLAGEMNHQEAVLDATNRRGKAIQCRVTCTPLTTPKGEQQGVILLIEEVEA